MATGPPRLPISWRPHAYAYEWACTQLKGHPALAPVIKTWALRSPDGKVGRAPCKEDNAWPRPADCPWVRVTPTPEPAEALCTLGPVLINRMPLRLDVDVAVTGGDFDNFTRLADGVHDAFRGVMNDLRATVRGGVSAVQILQQPLGSYLDAEGGGLVVGNGSYRLVIFA